MPIRASKFCTLSIGAVQPKPILLCYYQTKSLFIVTFLAELLMCLLGTPQEEKSMEGLHG